MTLLWFHMCFEGVQLLLFKNNHMKELLYEIMTRQVSLPRDNRNLSIQTHGGLQDVSRISLYYSSIQLHWPIVQILFGIKIENSRRFTSSSCGNEMNFCEFLENLSPMATKVIDWQRHFRGVIF